jgi:serine/threonine protein kinase
MPILTELNDEALAALTTEAEILEADSLGPKVYRLAGGNFLKLFRRKRLISSALFSPYSSRFYRNAEHLEELDIPTLTPLALYKLKGSSLSAVLYQPLPGQTLKDLYLQAPGNFSERLPQLSTFIRDLHRKGIYFRSLHLGNIVLTPQGTLGLIDVADLTFQRRPISKAKAIRNLAHFSRLLQQMGIASSFPFAELSAAVLED